MNFLSLLLLLLLPNGFEKKSVNPFSTFFNASSIAERCLAGAARGRARVL